MPEKIKVVSKTNRLLVCEADDAAVITNALVDNIPWPLETPTLLVNFKHEIPEDFAALNKNLSGKYLARLIYRTQRDGLTVPNQCATPSGIDDYPFKSSAEVQELYLSTEKNYFGGPWAKKLGYPWKQYLESEYLKIIQTNAEQHIPEAKVFCLGKSGHPIALLPLNKAKYFDGTDIDWITWVWIDPGLTGDERCEVKSRMVSWLKSQVVDVVATGANPFNVASNKFLKKIGFHSECLQITRPGY